MIERLMGLAMLAQGLLVASVLSPLAALPLLACGVYTLVTA